MCGLKEGWQWSDTADYKSRQGSGDPRQGAQWRHAGHMGQNAFGKRGRGQLQQQKQRKKGRWCATRSRLAGPVNTCSRLRACKQMLQTRRACKQMLQHTFSWNILGFLPCIHKTRNQILGPLAHPLLTAPNSRPGQVGCHLGTEWASAVHSATLAKLLYHSSSGTTEKPLP